MMCLNQQQNTHAAAMYMDTSSYSASNVKLCFTKAILWWIYWPMP